jgi:hypothetical protein
MTSDIRQPRRPRAVIEASAARYLLGYVKKAGLTSQQIHADAQWRRDRNFHREAHELVDAFDQLLFAAQLVDTDESPSEVELPRTSGSDYAEVADPVADSSPVIKSATAASLLGCDPRWVRELIRRGDLDGTKPAKAWLIPRGQVEDLAALKGMKESAV